MSSGKSKIINPKTKRSITVDGRAYNKLIKEGDFTRDQLLKMGKTETKGVQKSPKRRTPKKTTPKKATPKKETPKRTGTKKCTPKKCVGARSPTKKQFKK